MPDPVESFIEGVLMNAPTFLALGSGLVLALAWYGRHPPAATRAALGSAWLIAVYLSSIFWSMVLVPEWFPNGRTPAEVAAYVGLSVMEATGYLILLSAAFTGRSLWSRRHFEERPHDEDDDVHH